MVAIEHPQHGRAEAFGHQVPHSRLVYRRTEAVSPRLRMDVEGVELADHGRVEVLVTRGTGSRNAHQALVNLGDQDRGPFGNVREDPFPLG
jgi:hypothetical protein